MMNERFENMRPLHQPVFAIGGLVIAGVSALLFGLFIMLLWNWLMPVIFELPEITYWQGWGIAVLAHLLFKAGRWGADHFGRPPRDTSRRRYFRDDWRRRFRDEMRHAFDEHPPFRNGESPEDDVKREDV